MRSVILIVSVILLIGAWTSSAEKTNKIVVKLKPEVSLEELSLSHPLVKLERASTLPRVFLFSVENINDVDQVRYLRKMYSHLG
jgi:ERCC4-type nuclease